MDVVQETVLGHTSFNNGMVQLQAKQQQMSLLLHFGSAPGVPNWGGLLGQLRTATISENKIPAFDILYVVDARRSWYTENKLGEQPMSCDSPLNLTSEVLNGTALSSYYGEELEEAVKGYKRVVMIGDSMGASAALLFAQSATAVIAFCPQVDLACSCIRPGKESTWLKAYKEELLEAVGASCADISVHCSSWEHDLLQAMLLPKEKVNLVVHHNDDHRLSKVLKADGTLLSIVRTKIEGEIAAARKM